jgi:type III pantothenate kinase
MFLAIDIGNSWTKCGLFDGDNIVTTFAMETDQTASIAAYRHSLRSRLDNIAPDAAGVCSVVPSMTDMMVKAVRDDFMVLADIVGPDMDLPFELDYTPPESLGPDRLCAAAAATVKYAPDGGKEARPLVVVDAGTAITYELIADGVYRGGAIAPGPALAAHSLARGTGQLPSVELSMPKSPVANRTDDGLRSGIMLGFIDGVSGMVDRLTENLGTTPLAIATGGWGSFLVEHVDSLTVLEPHLVLEGIALMCRRTAAD